MIAYITGTSSGIGKALAELMLKNDHKVVGLSRNQTIRHPNYHQVTIDLSDINQTNAFNFSFDPDEEVILVNNAGTIGPIKPVGQQKSNDIIKLNNLNITAPQILSNAFIDQYSKGKQFYQIINISSGAAKRPIDAWAIYCASKAALDLFSESMAEELVTRSQKNWKIHAIAPGVVDTKMQSVIRQSNPKDFVRHQDFVILKDNDELVKPEIIALKLYKIISMKPGDLPVVLSLRDFE